MQGLKDRGVDRIEAESEIRGHPWIFTRSGRPKLPDAVIYLFSCGFGQIILGAMQTTTAHDAAIAHFAGKLRYETDPSDVHADQADGIRFALVDSRGEASWRQGRIVGAVHLPTAQIAELAPSLFAPDLPIVTYCWGPGCNGSTRAALEFARLGYQVREMIGGYEYWVREGFAVETPGGDRQQHPADPLTAPADAITCDC